MVEVVCKHHREAGTRVFTSRDGKYTEIKCRECLMLLGVVDEGKTH